MYILSYMIHVILISVVADGALVRAEAKGRCGVGVVVGFIDE